MWEKPPQKAEMKLLKVMISHSHFNTPFNSHNYVSYPSIVNIVYFSFYHNNCLMVHNHTCNAKPQT